MDAGANAETAVDRPGDRRVGTAAMLVAVALLGPADVAVTLSAWHLETNPVVLALGPVGWVVAKTAALGAAVWVWDAVRGRDGMAAVADAWMALLAAAAAVLVGVNLVMTVGA